MFCRHALNLLLQRRLLRSQLLLQRLRCLQLLPQGGHLRLGSRCCLSNRRLVLLTDGSQLMAQRGQSGLCGGCRLGSCRLLLGSFCQLLAQGRELCLTCGGGFGGCSLLLLLRLHGSRVDEAEWKEREASQWHVCEL